MILLKSSKVKIQGSKILKTRAREGGASVFISYLFPKAVAPAKRIIQRADKKKEIGYEKKSINFLWINIFSFVFHHHPEGQS